MIRRSSRKKREYEDKDRLSACALLDRRDVMPINLLAGKASLSISVDEMCMFIVDRPNLEDHYFWCRSDEYGPEALLPRSPS